jgi:hypothetical protein
MKNRLTTKQKLSLVRLETCNKVPNLTKMQKENRKQTSIAGRLQHIKPEWVHNTSNQTSRKPQHSACAIKKPSREIAKASN